MASEPSEEAIAEFISFTSATRPQALTLRFFEMQAHDGSSQKAINAFFEDPTGPHLSNTSSWQNESELTPFGFGDQEQGPRMPATAPPTRPPSRVNMHDTTKGPGDEGQSATNASGQSATTLNRQEVRSLADREQQELQQAVAMSLNQGMGTQETGVTAAASNSPPHFGKATRDHYDQGAWAMTLFNESSQEVINGPDPEDRKKVAGQPAFIRPTQSNLYLGGFLTILHEIPQAREALLLRNKLLFDYGQDAHWWNGQPINLPKIVTVHEGSEDSDWEDTIHETQRLMAFLDSTQRAFGSSDALAGLKQMNWYSSDSEEIVARFLETWHSAAIRADPNNPLVTSFMSHAYKRSPFDDGDEPISKELFVFEPVVEQEHGQTLYDVLDTAIWSDKPGEDLDDVWLEHVGDILVMKLDSFEHAKSVDVTVPAVFYPDRYLSTCQDLTRELRTQRLQAQEVVSKIEERIKHYTTVPNNDVGSLTRKKVLEKAADAIPVALKAALNGPPDDPATKAARERAEGMQQELRRIATRIGEKLQGLEIRKQNALEAMHKYSRMLTEPSEDPSQPPSHKYTLRGVCTEPHVTYVLKRHGADDQRDAMHTDGEEDGFQWWRISFSAEDGKAQQSEKREAQGDKTTASDGDVMGYTTRKVTETEVLQAAREEWRSVLLVYASDAALQINTDPAPLQLQAFVSKDNDAFAAECTQATTNADNKNSEWNPAWSPKTVEKQTAASSASQQDRAVDVFAFQVQDFDSEKSAGQEMQEKVGSSSLAKGTGPENVSQSLSQAFDDNEAWNPVESDDNMVDHVEHSPAN
ncbi:hypothetical protein N7466_000484 [Penicillium verhagenii]|uniref:uncharacterized protein n=1 Tax=Penicillium verhagenii TaxID=1562060 RepID=UPI0025456AFA|nr:uncharacterized protein N7466_000484 [Penicillium verhagenii]KAJ5947469.1 hypothetical protein N7466_000484 [Penicillium verhagenii]